MKKLFYLLLIVLISATLYAYYVGTTGLEVKEYFVVSEKIANGFDGFKIVQFSDTLFSSKTVIESINEIVNAINEVNPDIVVFTGDLLKENIDYEENLITSLSLIKPTFKKYAILGDHDNDNSKDILEKSDFLLIDDKCESLFNKDITPILICGKTYEEQNTEHSYMINLIHKPDDFYNAAADLTLAGHSLGGLIRLPYVGGLINSSGASVYTDDKYNHDGKVMFVSYGIGTDNIPLRLFNKPSINYYRLMTK